MKKAIFGLILSLVIPAFYVLFINPVLVKPNVPVQASILLGFAVLWALAAGVLVYTRTVERLPLATIGWKPLPWKQELLAVGLGIALSLLVPVLTLLTSRVFPPANTGTVTQVATSSTWWILLISVFTAGITEEILFRGYALERLEGLTKNRWVSGLVSLAFFVSIHAAGWNIAHIIAVVIPLGVILTGLYFWKRNLLFVMIVHVLIDLPLVFMALFA